MRLKIIALAAIATALSWGAADSAQGFGLQGLDVKLSEESGAVARRAGFHPFSMRTAFAVSAFVDEEGDQIPEGELRDVTISQMPGLVGSQNAVPRCSQIDFSTRSETRPACPDSTAVGYAGVQAEFEAIPASESNLFIHVPVYNLDPPPGVAAQLGFIVLNVPVTVDVKVSEQPPYSLVAEVVDTPQALLFYKSFVTLWGDPSSKAHDSLRGNCLGNVSLQTAEPESLGACPVGRTHTAFLTLPRACQGPLKTLFHATDWQGAEADGEAVTHNDSEPPQPIGMSDCGQLTFSPQISAQPSSTAAETSTGMDVNIEVNDEGLTNPEGVAQSDLKEAVVTFPEGVTANPSAGEGLSSCAKAQYEAASLSNPGCPGASKVGTVKITSPLIETPISGSVFLAQPDDPSTTQAGAENPFDSLLAVYLLLREPRYGIFVKQAGRIDANPVTGQLTSTFDEVPQLPFSKLSVHLREGARAPLVMPSRCGTYSIETELVPWANPASPLETSSSFEVTSGPSGGPCLSAGSDPFAPGFRGGTLNNNAGSFSPFYMQLSRRDGEQEITRFGSRLAPGLLAKLAGVGTCSDSVIEAANTKTGRSELASPSCPSSSLIGHVLAGAGVGSALTYVEGKIYLAGPFGGDPMSVVVITPAVAGPFDLGTVVTREALTLDPSTGEAIVDGSSSDPIPHILDGIPLRLRDLRVYLDREDFTLNATNCEPERTQAQLFGSGVDALSSLDDAPVSVGDRYQAANCLRLGFKPKLSLSLHGATRRSGNPALRSVLVARSGDANIGKAVVSLPPTEFIDNAHINNPCTRVQFNEHNCPKSSVLGHARAFSPLLDAPLEGPVYFRSNGGERLLPDIVADLNGQFHIVLVGYVKTVHSRIRTTFSTVPDAPVSKFVLSLYGGKRGLLENSKNLCARKQHVPISLEGQNGALRKSSPILTTSCHAKGKKK